MAPSHAIPTLDPAPSGASHRRRHAAPWIILGALFALTYAWTFRDFVRASIASERLVLSLVIFAGAAFLVWDRQDEIARAEIKPSMWGLGLLGVSVLLLAVGTRAHFVFYGGKMGIFLRGMSGVVFLCGALLLFAGWRPFRPFLLPAVLLVFVYPENFLTSVWLAVPLQRFATTFSARVVSLLGIEVAQRGHLLETATFAANVDEGCTGIRSLLTVVPTAIFISAYALRKPATRVALVLLAVPLTLFANVFRVSATVVLGTYFGTRIAEGFFHYFAGLAIFVVCLAGLLVLVRLLKQVEGREDTAEEQLPSFGQSSSATIPWAVLSGNRTAFWALGVALVIGLFCQAHDLHRVWASARKYPDAALGAVSNRIGEWTGHELEVELDLAELVHASAWLLREYRSPGGAPIQVLVLYRKPGAKATYEKRKRISWVHPFYRGIRQERTQLVEVSTESALVPRLDLHVSTVTSPNGSVLISGWHQLGLRPPQGRPRGFLRLAVYGVVQSLIGRQLSTPEVSCYFVSPLNRPVEQVVGAHRRFAALFIAQAADVLLAPMAESD